MTAENGDFDVPAFCGSWRERTIPATAVRISAAKELVDEADDLSSAEKVDLRASIDDITRDHRHGRAGRPAVQEACGEGGRRVRSREPGACLQTL